MDSDTVIQDAGFLTITQIARRCGVTLRALRFYEEKGILQPKRVGLQRFYSPKDRIRVELILTGKRLGFSLRAIEDLIASHQSIAPPDRGGLIDALDSDAISAQLAALERQKATLEAAIDELQNALESAK